MFEIGNSLREARLRQNLDFGAVEAGTKIRGRYLEALEAERFEVLPGETYVKGFLRTYAEFLGLDGQLYVDEFNSRFASVEEPLAPASSPPPRRPRHRVRDSNLVVVALAAIVAVTVLVVVGLGFGGDDQPADQSLPSTTHSTRTSDTTSPDKPKHKQKREAARSEKFTLTLRAADGECWLIARAGGPQGRQLYQGTLEQGQTLPLKGKKIWLQLGRPDLLAVKVDRHRLGEFPTASGAIVVVWRDGVRQLGTAY